MALVRNWQINREMSYWYPESRPQRQFAAVFDTNKCISCQTCTLACKTTWTSGKGQEYMLWNNVETKPYGFYPLAWDLKLLDKLGPQGILIIRHGKPVARLVPVGNESADLIGSMEGRIAIRGDILSTGIAWDAES